jgi:hypothetical protein
MKASVWGLVLGTVGLVVASTQVFAHHSNALVDKDRLYTVAGEVTKFAFVNPHVAIYWKSEDKQGKVIEWYASSAPPRSYLSAGWNTKTFKPGEKILVQGHPMRDGTPLMQFQALYHCDTGLGAQTDAGNLDEYRTRVKIVPLSAERVKSMCASSKLIEGELDANGRVVSTK